ncbi:condensation domain-containing protein [Chitinophaga solisilvae]|uniref:condensation domain-containing protein n=1 Tax=Chitinophaga solisilvae TaxID=1233460 RepID=UPI00136883AF|nr:condensation domain-containing protein [Chitinophaga solisilvae]
MHEEIISRLKEIWKEVLKTDHAEPTDTFVAAGGFSLKAVLLTNRIRNEFRTDVAVTELFNGLTIQLLAEKIAANEQSPFYGLGAAPLKDDYVLSYNQRSMLLRIIADGTDTAYNLVSTFIMDGQPDLNILNTAFFALTEKHEVLRTAIVWKDGTPYQRIREQEEMPFVISRETAAAGVLDALELEEMQRPYDPEKELLFRLRLLALDDGRYALLFSIHHLICDAWSLVILQKDLFRYYELFSQKQYPDNAPLAIQYKDFSEWQHRMLEEKEDVLKAFWSSAIPVLPAMNARNRAVPAGNTLFDGAAERVYLSENLTAGISRLARDREATPFIVLLTLSAVLQHYRQGENEVLYGTVLAGRDHAYLEEQVGLYVNTLPVFARIFPHMTFTEVLENMKDYILPAFSHQLYPLERILEDRLPGQRQGGKAPFHTVFQFLSAGAYPEDTVPQVGGLQITRKNTSLIRCKFDLQFNAFEQNGGIVLEAVYRKALYNSSEITALLTLFVRMTERAVNNPALTIHNICTGEIYRQQFSRLS